MLLTFYRRVVILVDRTLTWVYIRKFEVIGRENVPPQGPLIVASNHLNNADPPMIALALPRQPTFMAKQEMINWPVLGFLLKLYGAFPVRRGEADLSAIRDASKVLEEGGVLVMFPEGTRSRTGSMKEAHPGTGLIALRSGVPVLPAAITGTYGFSWPWIFLKPRSVKHVTVTFGEPFHVPPVDRINTHSARDATEFIMRRVAALLPPEYRGVYADESDTSAQARSSDVPVHSG
jgi:1-acyl-sn-glycerol-3-phosphate acyltransferase